MKTYAILISLMLFCLRSFAGEVVFQNSHATVFTNNIVSTNFVATGAITNNQSCIYTTTHCLQGFYTVLGTNAVATSNVVDSTIDGVNWFPEQTNSWTTNGSFEYTLIGKRFQLRTRTYFVTTNGNLTINYVAQ